jgi:AcrR family transcriptional regulator
VPGKPDKGGTVVRKAPTKELDPRVGQSVTALGSALIALMQERAFDAITVQNVLDRAGVARSTFYAHFSNKQDLFLSDYERLLAQVDKAADAVGPTRLLPVAELVSHFAEMTPLLASLRASGQMETMWQLAAAQFARTIERRTAALHTELKRGDDPHVAAVFCAGALVQLIGWWLERTDRPPAGELDRQFHDMAWRALR